MTKLKSLRQISIGEWMEYLIDNNLSVLGEGTDEELAKHGEDLFLKYTELTASTETSGKQLMHNQAIAIDLRLSLIQSCIDVLSEFYVPEIIEILQEEGFSYEFTEDSLASDLQKIITECKQLVLQRDELLTNIKPSEESEMGLTYEYFASLLNSISTMVKYHVDESINVLRYCSLYQQLLSNINKQEQYQ